MAVALESQARHVVFLKRKNEPQRARIQPFSRAEAARRLQSLICYGDERVRREQNRALTDFLRLPIVELTYCNFDDAESLLRKMVESEGLP